MCAVSSTTNKLANFSILERLHRSLGTPGERLIRCGWFPRSFPVCGQEVAKLSPIVLSTRPEGAPNARVGLHDSDDRNGVGRCVCARPDLRPELSGLPANLCH